MTTETVLGPIEPFRDYDEAASAILQLLQDNVGLALWLVTRREDDEWIVLTARDRGYGVRGGDVLRWSDSFCSRMVRGLGPNVAPDAARVESYAGAPIADQLEIGAYVGVPLHRPDGSLFGTLCAIDPEPQPSAIRGRLDEVVIYARLLGTILDAELERQSSLRKLERAEREAETDALTGLVNRRGWNRLMELEEERCRRYGSPAGIIVFDVNGLKQVNDSMGHGAGDELLRRTAGVLRATVRETDVAARLGGDEFVILLPEDSALAAEQLERRLREGLEKAGVRVAVGSARRDPRKGLAETLHLADERMRADKKVRSTRR